MLMFPLTDSGIVHAKNMATDCSPSRKIQHPNAEAQTRHRSLLGGDHQARAHQRAARPGRTVLPSQEEDLQQTQVRHG